MHVKADSVPKLFSFRIYVIIVSLKYFIIIDMLITSLNYRDKFLEHNLFLVKIFQ